MTFFLLLPHVFLRTKEFVSFISPLYPFYKGLKNVAFFLFLVLEPFLLFTGGH